MMADTTTTKTTTTVTMSETTAAGSTDNSFALRRVFIIFLASAVELIAAARVCDKRNDCKKEFAFAVAVGVVGVLVSGLFLLFVYFRPNVSTIITQVVSVTLLVLWGLGAAINTFRNPFKGTGNGYFATWLAFIESARFVYAHVPLVRWIVAKLEAKNAGASTVQQIVMVLLVASIVELCAAATVCDDTDCKKQVAWAVAVGAISTFVALLAAFIPLLGPFHLPISAITALLWIFGVGVLTFDSPFTFTGNGYFSSWIAFGAAMYWFYVVLSAKHPNLARRNVNV